MLPNSDGKPVHVNFDRQPPEGNKPTLALLPNRSKADQNNKKSETGDGDGKLFYAVITQFLNRRNVLVLYQFSKLKITFVIFTGPFRKVTPKLRLLTMEEILSDHDPKEEDRKYENQ